MYPYSQKTLNANWYEQRLSIQQPHQEHPEAKIVSFCTLLKLFCREEKKKVTISTVCHLRECPQCFTHITASPNNRPQALSLMMDSERLKPQTHSTSKILKLIAQLKNQSLRCSTRRTLMSNAKSVGLFPASKEVLEHLCLRMCALTIKGTLNQNIRSFLGAADP